MEHDASRNTMSSIAEQRHCRQALAYKCAADIISHEENQCSRRVDLILKRPWRCADAYATTYLEEAISKTLV